LYVVIATYDRSPLLRRTLESLAAADRPESFQRVIVVENGSDAGARQVCEQVADQIPCQYIHRAEAGKSRALQYVMEQLGSGFAFFTDDDVRVTPNLLTAYAEAAAREGPDAIIGGPLRIDYEGDPPPDWLVDFLPPSARGWEPAGPDKLTAESRFLGANYGASIERILQVGGFNAVIGPGAMHAGTLGNPVGQETDIQNRLIDAGGRMVHLPNVVVWHWVPRDRCSPRWALHRAYRLRLGDALRQPRTFDGPLLCGIPKWAWRRWLALGASAFVANFIVDAKCRFAVKIAFAKWRGYMAGMKQRLAMEAQRSNSDVPHAGAQPDRS